MRFLNRIFLMTIRKYRDELFNCKKDRGGSYRYYEEKKKKTLTDISLRHAKYRVALHDRHVPQPK